MGGVGWALIWVWLGGVGGGRLFEGGCLLTFSALGWTLIRGWALIRINTVYLSMASGLIWYLFVKKSVNQLYILISFGSEFQMMMTPQLLERLNKERTAWIPLVIQWVGLLDCMNAMVVEETRYDDSYSDCCTFVQFSTMMAIFIIKHGCYLL